MKGKGWITFEDAVAYSRNVVAAKVALALGTSTRESSTILYDMWLRLGYGEPTGIDLAGEVGEARPLRRVARVVAVVALAHPHEAGRQRDLVAGVGAGHVDGPAAVGRRPLGRVDAVLVADQRLQLVLVDHLAHQPQHAPYDISHNHFSWLRRCQPPAHLLYALNELGSVPSLELADYAQKQSRRRNGAWPRIPYLSSFEKSGAGLSVVVALLRRKSCLTR